MSNKFCTLGGEVMVIIMNIKLLKKKLLKIAYTAGENLKENNPLAMVGIYKKTLEGKSKEVI